MKKHALIVASNDSYALGTLALLNSFLRLGLQDEVDFVLAHTGWGDCLGDRVVHVRSKEAGNCILWRNQVCLDLADYYDSIALFDADMFLTSSPMHFFGMAASGYPVLGNEDTIVDQGAFLDHQGRKLVDRFSDRIVCAVPMFFSSTHARQVYSRFFELHAQLSNGGDLEAINLALSSLPEILDRAVIFPSVSFTGIHHTFLKPQTAYVTGQWRPNLATALPVIPDAFLTTRDAMRVYSVHGKYWDRAWVDGLLLPMHTFYAHEFGLAEAHKDKWISYNTRVISEVQKIFAGLLVNGPVPVSGISSVVKPEHWDYLLQKVAGLAGRA